MLTSEVKNELIRVVSNIVIRHQEARARVTEDMVDAFMSVRSMPGFLTDVEEQKKVSSSKT